jgi:hypothetical protein
MNSSTWNNHLLVPVRGPVHFRHLYLTITPSLELLAYDDHDDQSTAITSYQHWTLYGSSVKAILRLQTCDDQSQSSVLR